ncbi:MAG TPA: right-handed parallel beta-helix repeat-containing protein [Tepidisphaeraceae bacterium]|nr:right-handed parallel beta-helix repeat-containing protein [Tepidisphaeraceae bacterium]
MSRGRRQNTLEQPGRRKIARAAAAIAVEKLEDRRMLSTTWFVATSGSDDNAGNQANPFKTIQAAADVAQAGDHVEIRGGVYDETVTPKNSGSAANPIVYEAYNGEAVTVSGASPLTNWTLDTGDIYESQLSTNLGEGNNQLFVNGQYVNEARFPASTNLSKPNLEHASSVTVGKNSATIHDPSLSQSSGYWVGAVIHILPGQAWTAQTGTVTSSSPGQITFSYTPGNSYELPTKGNGFYLTGTLKALTAPGEFYADSSGKVYLWTPSGNNPNSDSVAAKKRADAFNLNGVSHITVQNIAIVAATVSTNGSSSSIVLNHLNVDYPSQFLSLPRGWSVPTNSGVLLNGSDDLLENSVIADSPGDGVYIDGAGSRVTNNIIHDVDTSAGDAAAIRDVASNVEIDHNTIYNTGRDGIKHDGQKLQILYNKLYDIGLQTTEAGAIYSVRTNGGGTVIAYNNITDMHSGGYGQTALFLDDYSDDYVIHDNIVSNVDIALKLNYISENNNVYNNTLDGTQETLYSNYKGDWNGTKLTNNIFLSSARIGSGATATGNVTTMGVSGKGAASAATGSSGTVGTGTSAGGVIPPSDGGDPPVTTPPVTTPPVTTPPVTTPPVTTPPVTTPPVTTPPVTTPPVTTPPVTTPPVTTPPVTTPPDTTPPVTSTPPPDVPAPAVIYGPAVPASYSPPTSASPSLAALTSAVQVDRAAVVGDISQRQATMKQLHVTLKSDKAAYFSARKQFSATHRAAARAQKNPQAPQPQPPLTEMQAEIAALLQQVQADRTSLKEHRKSDFTGIGAAKKIFAKAMQGMRAARRTGK